MSTAQPESHTSEFSLTVLDSTDVHDRSLIIDDPDLGYNVFDVTAVKKLDEGDTFEVSVETSTTTEYQLEVFDRQLNTALWSSNYTGNATHTFDSTDLDTGTYVVAVMVDGEPEAVFPLVVRAYEVTVEFAPSGIHTCDSLTVTADLSPVDGGATIDRVQLAIWSTDNDTMGTATMDQITTNRYEVTIEDLGEDEYIHGVIVSGDESLDFDFQEFSATGNEAIGFSDQQYLTVEYPDSEKLDPRWSTSRDGRLQYSSVALQNGELAFMGGLDSTVEALWQDSGVQKWQLDRDGSLSDSSPVVYNDTVFIGSGGGVLYARDASDGTDVFSVQLPSAITSTPVVLNGTVYFATNDGQVHAVDVDGTSGSVSPKWSTNVGSAIYSDLAAGGGQIYATTLGGDLVALTDGGAEVWRHSTGVELQGSSPTYHDGSVYVAADDVHAYDESGSERWTFTGYGGTAGSDPTVREGIVYVGSADGKLYALNGVDGGSELWTAQTGDAIAATPAVRGSEVVVASMDGSVYVYDRTTGSPIWSRNLGEEMRSSPTVGSNDVFVGTESGNVYALENLPELAPDATPVTVIDSFEHQDVTNNGWTSSGSTTADWAYSSDFVGCGDVSLALTGNYHKTLASFPGDGLPAYPKQGDAVKFDWQTTLTPGGDDGQLRFNFAADAEGNAGNVYRLDMDIGDDLVALYDRLDDRPIGEATGVGLQADTHYTTILTWDDGATFGGNAGDMTVRVVDREAHSTVARISGNDTARTEGGVKIDHAVNSTGDTIYSDYYRIMNR